MGICNSPDIFQDKSFKLFEEFDTVLAHIYYVIVIIKDEFSDHIEELKIVLQKLSESGLKVD